MSKAGKKKMQQWYNQYKLCGYGTIYSVYRNPSQAKINAWERLRRYYYSNEKMPDVSCAGVLKVLSFNNLTFTTGIVIDGVFYVHTSASTYQINIEELY